MTIISVCDEQMNSKVCYCNKDLYCHIHCHMIAWARSMCLSSNLYEKKWSGFRRMKDWLKHLTFTAGSEFPWSQLRLIEWLIVRMENAHILLSTHCDVLVPYWKLYWLSFIRNYPLCRMRQSRVHILTHSL
jgi:hypothetical protein